MKFHYTFVVCTLFILSVADTREGMYLHGYLHGTHNNSQTHTCIQNMKLVVTICHLHQNMKGVGEGVKQ